MGSEEHAESKVVARGDLVVNVRSGRQCRINVPVEWTEIDTLDLISYLAADFERELSNARGGTRRLVVPTGPLGTGPT